MKRFLVRLTVIPIAVVLCLATQAASRAGGRTCAPSRLKN